MTDRLQGRYRWVIGEALRRFGRKANRQASTIPALRDTRENGRASAWPSNMTQVVLVFDLYPADYDGVYPGAPPCGQPCDRNHQVCALNPRSEVSSGLWRILPTRGAFSHPRGMPTSHFVRARGLRYRLNYRAPGQPHGAAGRGANWLPTSPLVNSTAGANPY